MLHCTHAYALEFQPVEVWWLKKIKNYSMSTRQELLLSVASLFYCFMRAVADFLRRHLDDLGHASSTSRTRVRTYDTTTLQRSSFSVVVVGTTSVYFVLLSFRTPITLLNLTTGIDSIIESCASRLKRNRSMQNTFLYVSTVLL